MSGPTKETVYIDIDDEITTIIDKIRSSQHKIVALVLPKRASMLQSTVNMKLLKRAADDSKKQLVLITSESGLMPLAGAVGLPVAKTLQSKPEIPEVLADETDAGMEDMLTVGDEPAEEFNAEDHGDKAVGELDQNADADKTAKYVAADETIALDDMDKEDEKPAKSNKKSKNKKLKVPNFNSFRNKVLIAIAALVVLIILFIIGTKVLPHATVTIGTNTSNVNGDVNLTLDKGATSVNIAKETVPAQTQQQQKTSTESAQATGQKNNGNTANGSVTMTAEKCGGNPFIEPSSVPAGTGITANGLTFITQQTAQFNGTGSNGGCFTYSAGQISVTAQAAGSQYNVNNASFSVPGRSDVSASGSTNGGSDNIVTVVQQSDIDSVEAKIKSDQNADSIKQQLANSLKGNGLYPITATFKASTPSVSSSVSAGTQASNVTVTETINYTMFGVNQADLQKLLDNSINGQINTAKQSIQNDGLSSATYNVTSQNGNTADVSIQTTAIVGPKLDINSLKSQIAGKKSGDIQSIISNNPGVKSVNVHFSPFWVGSAPSNTSKITIKFNKS